MKKTRNKRSMRKQSENVDVKDFLVGFYEVTGMPSSDRPGLRLVHSFRGGWCVCYWVAWVTPTGGWRPKCLGNRFLPGRLRISLHLDIPLVRSDCDNFDFRPPRIIAVIIGDGGLFSEVSFSTPLHNTESWLRASDLRPLSGHFHRRCPFSCGVTFPAPPPTQS